MRKDRRARNRSGPPEHRAAVAAWVAQNGWVCPGWRRRPHPARDLTADHIVPYSQGGRRLRVLCRSCNSRKGPKRDDPPVTGPAFKHPLV